MPPPPGLEAELSPAAQAQGYPALVPLAPILSEVDGLLPQRAADQGQSLDWRAADLRRRAAALQALPL